MVFFRTRESRGDRSIGDGARRQRQRQHQLQQQALAAQQAVPLIDPALIPAVEP